jgi:hypothetical protein
MNNQEIISLVKQLDTADRLRQETTWEKLRLLREQVVPYLFEAYPSIRRWQGRAALVFHSTRFARTSDAAFRLGLIACGDKATVVRYRACGLLAYSLRAEAIPHLEALRKHREKKTAEDAAAAIDAIERQNHHYFIDRGHTGQIFWQVNDEATPA